MKRIYSALFLLLMTFVGISQASCDTLCLEVKENQNVIVTDYCPCFLDLYEHYSETYQKARDNAQFEQQGEALEVLAKILKLPLPSDVREEYRIRYLFNFGVYNKTINNIEHANRLFNEVLQIISDPNRLAGKYFVDYNLTLHQLAEIATNQSRFNEAINHLQQAINLELIRVVGTDEAPIISSMQSRIGFNYSQLENHEAAYEYFQQGNEKMKNALDTLSEETLQLYRNYFIGYFSWEAKEAINLGLYEAALKLLRMIRSIQVPDHPRNNNTYQLWAEYFSKTNQIDSAKHYFSLARKGILSYSNHHDAYLKFQLQYAHFLLDQNDQVQALSLLDSAAMTVSAIKSSGSKWSRDMVLAEKKHISLLLELGDAEKALLKISDFTDEVTDRLQGAIIFEDHISFINDFYPILEQGLRLIQDRFPNKAALAFNIMECTKAISLYKSSLLSTNSQTHQQDSLILKYKQLTSLISQHLLEKSNGDSTLENSTRLYEYNEALNEVKAEISSAVTTEKIDLERYQITLDKQYHILCFAGTDHYYFLNISNQSALLRSIDKQQLLPKIKSYIEAISDFNSNVFAREARALGKELDNILLLPEDHELIFSGDGLLGSIPLESLITTDDQLILTKYPITYSPSAKIQFALKTSRVEKSNKAAIFRPSFNSGEVPLDFAKKESRIIRKITDGDLFIDAEATKESFIQLSEEYTILHLATHAHSIDDDPSKSYINFTNSRLYFDEINTLILNAELVCLSACETNTGKNYDGEGVQSLSRNFLASGAKSVVSSLWSIPDQTTSDITIGFYKYLKKGLSKSQALQKAKIDFITSHPDQGEHPYNWAGLILNGDQEPIFNAAVKSYRIGSLIMIGVLIIFLLVLIGPLSSKVSLDI